MGEKRGLFHADSRMHWFTKHKLIYKKRKKRGKQEKSRGILPVFTLQDKQNPLHQLWKVLGGTRVTLRRCPLERGRSWALLETPAGNCQQFLRKAFHGRVSAPWICLGNAPGLGGAAAIPELFWTQD